MEALYVGSTTDLIKRIWEHKNNVICGFTAKYNIHQLVYYEVHRDIMEAARRERRLKNWCRQWKLNLIEHVSPLPTPFSLLCHTSVSHRILLINCDR